MSRVEKAFLLKVTSRQSDFVLGSISDGYVVSSCPAVTGFSQDRTSEWKLCICVPIVCGFRLCYFAKKNEIHRIKAISPGYEELK